MARSYEETRKTKAEYQDAFNATLEAIKEFNRRDDIRRSPLSENMNYGIRKTDLSKGCIEAVTFLGKSELSTFEVPDQTIHMLKIFLKRNNDVVEIRIRSASRSLHLFDWSKNKKAVWGVFEALEQRISLDGSTLELEKIERERKISTGNILYIAAVAIIICFTLAAVIIKVMWDSPWSTYWFVMLIATGATLSIVLIFLKSRVISMFRS